MPNTKKPEPSAKKRNSHSEETPQRDPEDLGRTNTEMEEDEDEDEEEEEDDEEGRDATSL
ncbi:MAG TPA: hypothetical protein VKT81_01155 [Bryobacteraceae bacterium]|nr:hypothetical protein [Bryobacteraceae bacterium]